VIAVANQKGGVGKTTTVMNLGAALAEKHQTVLLIDMDPQAALTAGFGLLERNPQHTLYDTLIKPDIQLDDAIYSVRKNLDIIPSNIDLAAAEVELISVIGREYVLRDALVSARDRYDFVVVDCQPNLGLLTINALTAADEVLIPLQCEYLALRGMRVLLDTIRQVQAKLNPELELVGILGTMYKTGTIHSREVLEEVRTVFGDRVFPVVVKDSIRVAEAPVLNQPILEYDPKHQGSMAYRYLAEVIIHGKKETS
jgi:chromosome partitioning protein